MLFASPSGITDFCDTAISSMSFARITFRASFSPLSVTRVVVLGGEQAALDAAVLERHQPREVRGADDAVGVEDVDEQVLDVAAGAVEVGADVVPAALELVALGAGVLEHLLPALERRPALVRSARASCR